MIELFVPGRLCLLGEHSDWAGGYRRQNSQLEKGYAIVCPTNEGNSATVKTNSKKTCKFIFQDNHPFEMSLNPQELLKVAKSTVFYSYIAGTLYQISLILKDMPGIEIHNYSSTIPLKKGLSSSASICVLVAKAYNALFNLGWTIPQEMELAYLGEITTPSRCGRMDQACAYNQPTLMTFDGNKLKSTPLQIKDKLFMVVVDLHASKDTLKILSALNRGYPFAIEPEDYKKQSILGIENKKIVMSAVKCLKTGDAQGLGNLMKKAQQNFDLHLAAYSPNELIAPKLHSILYEPSIQNLIYGAKGVGSQGDGSAQILTRNKDSQLEIINILENKFDVSCFCLNI